MITFAVYGVVGIIVKLDDMGASLFMHSHTSVGRKLGKGLVGTMPVLLKTLSSVGTIAMLWVGGSIIVHGLASLGFHTVEEFIHSVAQAIPAERLPFPEAIRWVVTSFLQAVLAVLTGLVAVVIVHLAKRIARR